MSDMIHDDEDVRVEDDFHDDDDGACGSVLRFDDLLFACSHLCDLLEIENDALDSHDAETVRVLAENKVALTNLYEQSVQRLVDEPALVETLEPEQQEALLAVGTRLRDLITINERRLRAEIEAHRRVMDIIVGAAKRQATNTTTYGRAGTFDATAPAAGSISYNKSL